MGFRNPFFETTEIKSSFDSDVVDDNEDDRSDKRRVFDEAYKVHAGVRYNCETIFASLIISSGGPVCV